MFEGHAFLSNRNLPSTSIGQPRAIKQIINVREFLEQSLQITQKRTLLPGVVFNYCCYMDCGF